ncbi:MAG: universal stress protein [Bacteroidetes bacterium]|nr:universal stress protein [Bacteroidota bacterium]
MKLLFATDLSEPKSVTDQVQALCESLSAELHVVHVHVPTSTTPLGVDPLSGFGEIAYALYDPSIENAVIEEERHEFDRFIRERFTIKVRPALHQGDPARVILDDAEQMKVDMIILAKRRHSAIERMLLGSVSDTIAREASQPVVLMPIVK